MSFDTIRDDITVIQGTTFADSFTCTDADDQPVDLTGVVLLMQARANSEALNPLLSLSLSDGLAVDGPAGVIYRTISPAKLLAMPLGTWPYDLFQQETDGTVNCLAQGFITVNPRETHLP